MKGMNVLKGEIRTEELILGGILLAIVGTNIFMIRGSWITLLISVVMIASIIGAYCTSFKKLISVKREFQMLTDVIQELAMQTEESTWESLRDAAFQFENKEIQEAWEAYRSEMDRLYIAGKQSTSCNIDDYINEDIIYQMIHKQLLDQIPGALTGLGILGTFIGLTKGLQQFDATDVTTMTNSIQVLIEGIKVAFYTSIFGVSLSLGFTFLYKRKMGSMQQVLNTFYDVFYRKVVPNSENEIFSKLMIYQQSQADSMAQFAESISLELAKSLNHYVTPTMEKLTGAIDQIAVNASHNQQESMERMTNSFISQLDNLMGNQFQNLGHTIEKLCNWQESTMLELQKVISEICLTAKDIKDVNEHSKNIIENMESYTAKLHLMQGTINESIGELTTQVQGMSEHYNNQNEYVNNLIQQEAAIQQAIIDLEGSTKTYIDQINESVGKNLQQTEQNYNALEEMVVMARENIGTIISESKDATKSMGDVSQQIIEHITACAAEEMEALHEQAITQTQSLNTMTQQVTRYIESLLEKQVVQFDEAVERLAEEITKVKETLDMLYEGFDKDMENALNRTFEEFDQNLSEICRHLSGTIGEIKQVSQNVPAIINMSYENMQQSLDQYIRVVESMGHQAEALINQTEHHLKVVNERM